MEFQTAHCKELPVRAPYPRFGSLTRKILILSYGILSLCLIEDPEIGVVVGACEIVAARTPEIKTENLR